MKTKWVLMIIGLVLLVIGGIFSWDYELGKVSRESYPYIFLLFGGIFIWMGVSLIHNKDNDNLV